MKTTPTTGGEAPSPEAEALPTLPVVAWGAKITKAREVCDPNFVAYESEEETLDAVLAWNSIYECFPLVRLSDAEAAIVALRAEVERLNLLVMQGADGRAEAAHAERYYRQAEALLTTNERVLHAEVAELRKDAERLDWLLANPNTVCEDAGNEWFLLDDDSEPTYFKTGREAIDTARAALLGDGGTL